MILDSRKIIKNQRPPKTLSESTHLIYIWEYTTHGITKCKNKSYTFENPKTTFMMNKNLSCKSKYEVNETECKEICKVSTKALSTGISLHKSNIRLTENKKNYMNFKHPYKCSIGSFRTMLIYHKDGLHIIPNKRKTSL